MTIIQALRWGYKKLSKKSASALLDTEVLLAFVIKKEKVFLYSHPERELTNKQTRKFKKMILRRAAGMPVAYLTKSKEFYDLNFIVNKNILIPRPETELMVEEVLNLMKNAKENIVLIDAGTGSGCVPIAIGKKIKQDIASPKVSSRGAKQFNLTQSETDCFSANWRIAISSQNFFPSHTPPLQIFATDISAPALAVARRNARAHQVKIKFLKGNLLLPVIKSHKLSTKNKLVITANLPYLTAKQMKEKTVRFEPRYALFGGRDGLDYYRELLTQIKKQDWTKADILLEIDPSQSKKIKSMIKKFLPAARIEIKKDLAEKERVVIIQI